MRVRPRPPPPRPNQQEMTGLTPTSEKALKCRLHLFSNTQRGDFPASSPRRSRPPTQPASARMGSARLAPLWAPSPRLSLPSRPYGGRTADKACPGLLRLARLLPQLGASRGAALEHSPRRAQVSRHTHPARARHTMATVSPRRSASVRPFGLQLPEIPAARRTPRCGRRTSWRPTRGGRRSPVRGKSALGDPAGQEEAFEGQVGPLVGPSTAWAARQAEREPRQASRAATRGTNRK